MAIAKVSLNNLLLIAILASSSVNAASQDIRGQFGYRKLLYVKAIF